jgi:DNA-binding NarL/FixJ family response regulator
MGADGFVLKRALATDLLPTVESVLAGRSGAAPTAENGILNLA